MEEESERKGQVKILLPTYVHCFNAKLCKEQSFCPQIKAKVREQLRFFPPDVECQKTCAPFTNEQIPHESFFLTS